MTARVCTPGPLPHVKGHAFQLPMLQAYVIVTGTIGGGVSGATYGMIGAGVAQLLHDPGHENLIDWSV
jgi:hypothetical protein